MKTIFCANEQKDTAHEGRVDVNGELVFTCSECGSFIKFPGGMKLAEIKEKIKENKEANVGQVKIEESEKLLADLMAEESQSNDKPDKS